MSEWKPEVVQIEKVEKHPFADNLDVATVLGDYPVIVKRGDYKVGDTAGYIPIDTQVPDTEQFYFLCPLAKEKYEDGEEIKERVIGSKYPVGSVPEKYRRIKAKKIRNIYSQGLLVSVPPELTVGTSLVDILGLTKWEEENEENLPGAKFKRAPQVSPPKGWAIPYYDIDGLRKYTSCLQENEEIIVSEKINGSNSGYCYDGNQLWVKSRNLYKKTDETDDMWVEAATRYDLFNKLSQFPMKVFYGELYGLVKGFRYDAELSNGVLYPKIRFFDILDVKSMRYLDYDDMVNILNQLELPIVPLLYRGPWLGKDSIYPYAEGVSTLNPKHVREGFVLRTAKERYEERLNSRMQVKLIGEGYNLIK